MKRCKQSSMKPVWPLFRMGIAQVREILEDDDELIPELEKIKLDLDVKFKKELIPSIVDGEPTVWLEEFNTDPMKFIHEWGIEMEGPFADPEPLAVVHPTARSQESAMNILNAALRRDVMRLTEEAESLKRIHQRMRELKEYEIMHQMLTIVYLRNDLLESRLQLEEADDMIGVLYHQMDGLEDKWIAKLEFLKWQLEDLEKDRATMVLTTLIEDSSSSSSDDPTKETIMAPIAQIEEIPPTFVKNPMTALVVYVPPPPSSDLTIEMVEVTPPIPSVGHMAAPLIVKDDIVEYRSELWESEAESDFLYSDDWDDFFN
ncbi:hypothetical protein Dimus_018282 [Dionaea muscipula]